MSLPGPGEEKVFVSIEEVSSTGVEVHLHSVRGLPDGGLAIGEVNQKMLIRWQSKSRPLSEDTLHLLATIAKHCGLLLQHLHERLSEGQR